MRLSPETKLRKKISISRLHKNGSLSILNKSSQIDIELIQGQRSKVVALLNDWDGTQSISDLAEKHKFKVDSLIQIASHLCAVGLLYSEENHQVAFPIKTFCDDFEKCAKIWRRHMVSHRIFSEITKPEMKSRNILKGLLVELHHFVSSTPSVMMLAAKSSDDKAISSIFHALSKDEAGHEKYYEAVLLKLGITTEEIQLSNPLGVTQSLIGFQTYWAIKNPIVLAAMLEINEASSEDPKDVSTYLKDIEQSLDLDEMTLEPIQLHYDLDASMDHAGALRAIFESKTDCDVISSKLGSEILTATHEYKHIFDNFHEGILSNYQQKEPPNLGYKINDM